MRLVRGYARLCYNAANCGHEGCRGELLARNNGGTHVGDHAHPERPYGVPRFRSVFGGNHVHRCRLSDGLMTRRFEPEFCADLCPGIEGYEGRRKRHIHRGLGDAGPIAEVR
jgi:hypothetical protein